MLASLAVTKPFGQALSKRPSFSIFLMKDQRRRRFLAYFEMALAGSRETLMRRTGYTKGRISQLFDDDQPFGELAARNLAERLGLAVDYFEMDRDVHNAHVSPPVAQSVSLSKFTVPPELVEWERLMKNDSLPELFRVVLPDDAMSPEAKAGWQAEFDRRLKPGPGRGVLVRLANGEVHFRRYRQGRAGEWEARADNERDFPHFESTRDGLEVIAVLSNLLVPGWGLSRDD
jgi:hypothetical protein